MQVRDAMTKKPLTVRQNDTLKRTLEVLAKNKISGCPVVDGKKNIMGVVAQTDVLNLIDLNGKVHKSGEFISFIASFVKDRSIDIKKLHTIKVKDFCNRKPITIDENSEIYDAARIMNKYDIERLPVLKNKKLVGIVTRSDVIRALGKM